MSNPDEVMDRIRKEPFAFIQEEPKSLHEASKDCSLTVLKDPNYYINGRFAIAFRKDSPYLPLFNKAIIQLRDSGFLDHLKRKHFNVGCLRSGAIPLSSANFVVVLFSLFLTFLDS